MRKLLIKLLFKLLEHKIEDFSDIKDKAILAWVRRQKGSEGFIDYHRRRSYQIMKQLSSGIEGKQYWIYMGQRYEILQMLDQVAKVSKAQKKP